MLSSDAGISGVSGDISLGTGIATARFDRLHDGHSGAISITTGGTRGIGRSGDISLRVGLQIWQMVEMCMLLLAILLDIHSLVET